MSACDVLTKLDDEILAEESQWTKGAYVNWDGQRCLAGGLAESAKRLDESPWSAGTIIAGIINSEENVKVFGYRYTTTFNDTSTFAEVKGVIREARRIACDDR